jgi:hypothetical protein
VNGEGAFLTTAQFESGWRPLSARERAAADALLAAAGQWIRDEYRKVHGTEIADDNPNAILVSRNVVQTAITTGAYVGHISYSRTEGPRSKSGTFANPGGALVFSDWHKTLLGFPVRAMPEAYFDGYEDARY